MKQELKIDIVSALWFVSVELMKRYFNLSGKWFKWSSLSEHLQSNSESSNGGSTEKKKPASWQRSVGGLSSSKSALGMLVKKKQPSQNQQEQNTVTSTSGNNTNSSKESGEKGNKKDEFVSVNDHAETGTKSEPKKSVPSGLGLLGSYSDSESNGSESD